MKLGVVMTREHKNQVNKCNRNLEETKQAHWKHGEKETRTRKLGNKENIEQLENTVETLTSRKQGNNKTGDTGKQGNQRGKRNLGED